MNEEWMEEIRQRFFRVTNIDMNCLEPDEIHALLELLPSALIYLHQTYFIAVTDGPDDDGIDPS